MTRFWVLLLGIGLLPLSLWAAEEPIMPLGSVDFGSSAPYLTVVHTPSDVTSIALLNPNVVSENKLLDYRQYKVFGIPGEPFRPEEGFPTVPHVTRFYRIPDVGSVDLVVNDARYDVVDNVDVLPYQMDGDPDLSTAAAVDGWYPPNVAEASAPMVMRDFRVVLVTLNPVQVNPSKRQVRIYRSINVDVVPNDRPGINEITYPRRPSEEFEPIYRSLISNFDDRDMLDATTRPGSYLILCNSDAQAKQWADSLFEWKTRKGFRAVIDARSSWTTSAMMSSVQQNWISSRNTDTPLEFVCLVGDPAWAFGVPTNSSDQTFDHNFGRADNSDQTEDIAVGRLSGSGATEMQTISAKIMGYERTPWMADTTWYHRAYFTGDISGHPSPAISNYRASQWGARQFRHFTCINDCYVDSSNGAFPCTQTVQQINNGISFFCWRGSWYDQNNPSCVDQTNPGWRLPLVCGITCSSNEFASGTGFMERFLTAGTPTQPKGGVAAIGTATLNTHQPPNICLSGGLIYNIANLGIEHFGTAAMGAKLWLFRTFLQQSTFPAAFSGYCNLMGDPGLSMWTCVPTRLNVTHPTVLNVGARQLSVTVMDSVRAIPIADAIVTAWKRGSDSTYALGRTNASGQLTLPLNVNAPGDLLLTVTKHNVKPYLYTIPCVQAAVMPMVSSFTVVDSGNGDGQMNPGETISLPTYIRNFGNSITATNDTAFLSSADPRVTVITGTANYPNLAPGDSASGSVPFRIHSAADLQNGVLALLTVTIHSSAGQTAGVIPLTCQAGEAAYVRQHISTSSFEPGSTTNLQVVLKNQGSIPMNGVTGRLISHSPFVSVTDSTASFGNMAAGVLDSNTADVFTLSASALTFRGHQASLMLILTTTSNFADTVQFTVNVGTAQASDPTGPDAYGYYAYDDSDLVYDLHPTFNYVDISQPANRLPINDVGEQPTVTPVYSVARRLPFTFKFYGQRYDTITICSNGWVAFGDQSYNDLFRNYPMPAMQAPDAMIAPYWDDLKTSDTGQGQGVYVNDDVANHRFIIQWKAGGGYSQFATQLNFEVILLDATYYPTFDGNGKVLMQYQTVSTMLQGDSNDEPGCTVGVQDQTCTVGLNYLYESSYSPGAATVRNGRAILFTTEVNSNTPQPLSLSSPNAGVLWFENTVDSIAWYGGNHDDHIHIELSRTGNGGSWETLAASAPNSRTFGYTVGGPVSTNCFVRISSVEHPSEADTSSGSFTISSMRLTTPNGGDVWYADSSVTVLWQGGYAAMGIRIELSRNGTGGPWSVINPSAPNTGSYTFTVTGATSSTCRVRLTSLYDPADTDLSDADFSIAAIQTVFAENFEGGGAGWTHAAGAGWRDNWNLSVERAYNSSTSYKCGSTGVGNYSDSCDARLTSPSIANLPANATLSFFQQIESEISGVAPDSAYDGGVLEISTDGGAFAAIDPVGNYPKHFRTTAGSGNPFTGPMPGRGCWAGTVTTWTTVQANLAAYAGHAIQLRWRFGSDKTTNAEGWYVDDVRIVAPVVIAPPPTVPTSVTIALTGNNVVLRWADDGNAAYRIYGASTAYGPYETLIGSTTANTFALPDSTNSTQKFFMIVGWDGH